ncbi:MAG: FAD:protein FMN transferase [Deltaproteobacteria bacterium]|nr:FAD:protein FMN transferase [Deltaproteobacteria bacterium]
MDSRRHACEGITRRSFLRLSSAAGLGLVAGALPIPCTDAVLLGDLYRVAETRLAMGTFVSIIALDSSRMRAQDGIGAAYEEIERLTRLLNRFDHHSPVAQLNRQGRLDDPRPELLEVIDCALAHHELSAGAFDISVQPLVDLFRAHHADGELPSRRAIERALDLVDAADILASRLCIRFARPGMGITLDGIAKGYIVDRASTALSRLGIASFLINAGGDIRARGHGRREQPWRVAVQDPDEKGRFPAVLRLTDAAVATSGNYAIYYDREKLFHHIVSPATGLSPGAAASVSVLARTAMQADALSTGVFVMGPRLGTRFIDSMPACECLVLDRSGAKHLSRAWPSVAL